MISGIKKPPFWSGGLCLFSLFSGRFDPHYRQPNRIWVLNNDENQKKGDNNEDELIGH